MDRNCLKDEEFIDYLEDRLPDRDRSRAEQHLSECDVCLEEVVAARGIVRGRDPAEFDPVPEEVTKRAIKAIQGLEGYSLLEKISGFPKEIFSKWFESFKGFFSWRSLRLAPVRSIKTVVSDDLILIKKSFPDLNAEIEIEKVEHDKARIWVKVPKEKEQKNPLRVSLLKNGRELSSYLVNDSGVFFEDLPFSHYVLLFTRNGLEVGEYSFEIKEKNHE